MMPRSIVRPQQEEANGPSPDQTRLTLAALYSQREMWRRRLGDVDAALTEAVADHLARVTESIERYEQLVDGTDD